MTTKHSPEFISNTCNVLNLFQTPACLVESKGQILGTNSAMMKEFTINSSTNKTIFLQDFVDLQPNQIKAGEYETRSLLNGDLFDTSICEYNDHDLAYFILNLKPKSIQLLWKRENIRNAFMRVADHISEGIYLTDIKGNLVFVNNNMCSRLNQTKEELIGTPFHLQYSSQYQPKVLACLDRVMAGETVSGLVTRKNDNTGVESWFTTYFTPVFEDKQVLGMMGVCIDNTLLETKGRLLDRYIVIEETLARLTQNLFQSGDLEAGLQEMGNILNIDRIGVIKLNADGSMQHDLVEWCRPEIDKIGQYINHHDTKPLYNKVKSLLKNEKHIVINDVTELPDDFNPVREILNKGNVKSHVIIPLLTKRELTGIVIFDDIKSSRHWFKFELELLKLFADVIQLYYNRLTIAKELTEKELQNQFLFEKSPIGTVFLDIDGNIVRANDTTATILGYKNADQLNKDKKKINDFIIPEMYNKIDQYRQEMLTEGKSRFQEYSIRDIYGNLKHIQVHSALYKNNGNVKGVISFVTDISDKKQLQLELLENEKKYRVLVNTAPMGIAMFALDGTIIQCNKKLATMLGYETPLSLIEAKKTHLEFIAPEQHEQAKTNMDKALDGKVSSNVVYRLQKSDGTLLLAEVNASVIRNEHDQPTVFTAVIRDVTLEQHIREKLIQSESNYRNLAEAAEDIIFIIDRDDKIIYVNNYAALQFKLKPEEMIGKPRSLYFEAGSSERQQKNLQRALSSGQTLYFEHKSDMPNKEIWLGTRLVPLMDENNEILSVMGIARDITERKRMEQEIVESKERYRLLVENQADLIVKVDVDGKFLFASPSYCQTFGKTEQELFESTFWPFVYPDDIENTKKAMQNLTKPPYKCQVEQRAMTVNGWRWFSWINTAVLDDNNNVEKIIGVGRDITEQKRIEDNLRTSEERFRKLAELLPEVVFEMDLEGNLLYINQYAYDLTGYNKKEFSGTINVMNLIVPADQPKLKKNLKEVMAGNLNQRNEYHVLTKDGATVPVIARTTTIENNGKVTGFRGIIMDISKIKQAEQAVIESAQQFRDSIERSLDGYYHINKNAHFTFLNYKAEKIIGFTVSELNRFIDNGLMENKKFESVVKTYNQVMGGKSVHWREFKLTDKTGKQFWVGLNARRVIESGIVKGVEGFIKDISKQKNAEIEIKNSEARYRSLFKNIPYEVFSLNTHGYFKDVNNQFIDKWGKVHKQKPENCITEPEFIDAIHYSITSINQEKNLIEREFRFGPADKATIYRLIMSPIITTENSIIGYIGLNIDITDQVNTINLSRQFSAQLVRFQEEEREQLAREIHDSLGQMLTALQFEIGAALASLQKNPDHTQKMLTESKKTLDKVIVEARNLYSELRPQLLDDFGIDVALQDYGKEFQEKWGINVHMSTEPITGCLDKDAEISLYRITQEALNNVLKYSRATHVSIELERKNEHIVLKIEDNGIGFNVDHVLKHGSGHYGLLGMKERVDILAGKCTVSSSPGEGTLITVIIPEKDK